MRIADSYDATTTTPPAEMEFAAVMAAEDDGPCEDVHTYTRWRQQYVYQPPGYWARNPYTGQPYWYQPSATITNPAEYNRLTNLITASQAQCSTLLWQQQQNLNRQRQQAQPTQPSRPSTPSRPQQRAQPQQTEPKQEKTQEEIWEEKLKYRLQDFILENGL